DRIHWPATCASHRPEPDGRCLATGSEASRTIHDRGRYAFYRQVQDSLRGPSGQRARNSDGRVLIVMKSKRIALVGLGAIGQAVLDLIKNDSALQVSQVIVSSGKEDSTRQWFAQHRPEMSPQVASRLEGERPDVLVECAGHGALGTHVVPALRQGIPCLVVSIGALSAPGLAEQLEEAARQGGTQVHLLSGAIGGIDALAAARVAGLDDVTYVGRKPPLGWLGSPAEDKLDLRNLKEKARFFEGSAREA